MEPKLMDNMKKKTLIQFFHPTHVLAYKSVGNWIDANTSIDNVMEFMKLQKQVADANEQKNKWKPDGQTGENEKGNKKKKIQQR